MFAFFVVIILSFSFPFAPFASLTVSFRRSFGVLNYYLKNAFNNQNCTRWRKPYFFLQCIPKTKQNNERKIITILIKKKRKSLFHSQLLASTSTEAVLHLFISLRQEYDLAKSCYLFQLQFFFVPNFSC